jgi:hypothetical protein
MLKIILLLVFISPVAVAAPPPLSRTEKQPHYKADPGHDQDKSYVFGKFEPNDKYEDPDFNYGQSLPSPLWIERFFSYDVIVMVQITDATYGAEPEANPAQGQHMRVYVRPEALDEIGFERFHLANSYDPDVGLLYYWKVSTAKTEDGKITPRGVFTTETFSSDHYSRSYNNDPMPYALFYLRSLYATHGTTEPEKLGTPASHGCIRLETQRARELFHLVGTIGDGPVDVINHMGERLTFRNGNPQKRSAYKTLYIIQ